MYQPCTVNLNNTLLLNLFFHCMVALATIKDLSAFPWLFSWILEYKCQNTYLQFTDSGGFVFLLNSPLLWCIFLRNIQGWQSLRNKKHHIKQERSRDIDTGPNAKLNHGNGLLNIHCSCSSLYIIVIALEQQSTARALI